MLADETANEDSGARARRGPVLRSPALRGPSRSFAELERDAAREDLNRCLAADCAQRGSELISSSGHAEGVTRR